MTDFVTLGQGLVVLLRFTTFGLALGITIISFQAYTKRGTEPLQYAFIGFAFISMGIATTSVITQLGSGVTQNIRIFFQIAEVIPFIIGFSMLYVSLYQ